ncbi:MAG: OmpA family protein [Bacteroidaceae bacterium]|nr:OmpA family protein [Bacteroidaceae bacterium]
MKIGKFLLAAVLMFSGIAASAQETEQVEFNRHWFIQLQGGANYTLGEAAFSKLISPAAQLSVGYQFTPVWAVRLGASGWQSKGGFDTDDTYKWNYVTPALDVKFNLLNALCGWDYQRRFGLNLIAGVGANIGWSNDDNAVAYGNTYVYPGTRKEMSEYWEGTKILPVGRFGLDVDYRVSKRVSLNLECLAHILSDKYNSKAKHSSKNADWYFNALLGVKIALSDPETIIPIPAPVVVEEPAPAPQPAATPKPQPVVEKAPEIRSEIFYSIRETVIPESQKAELNRLIAFLKQNPNTKVEVTGYADAGTGNPRINMFYSQGRADNVAKALVEAGISADRITVDYKGDTVQPFSENDKNRVTISIAK